MANLRQVVLVFWLFVGSFLAVRWFTFGLPVTDLRDFLGRASLTDSARARAEPVVAAVAPPETEHQRGKLRDDLIAAATPFSQSGCDDDLKQRYIAAAAAYARGFLALTGCTRYPSCAMDDPRVVQALKEFDTPADRRVKQAIREVHAVAVGIQDYPDNLGPLIVRLSQSGFIRQGRYSCTVSRTGFFERTEGPSTHYVDDHPQSQPVGHSVPPTLSENDRIIRDASRTAALQALRSPSPALCDSPAHTQLAGMVSAYYASRAATMRVNAIQSPEAQAAAEREWSTPIDRQIDGLVREFYTEGYLRPSDLTRSPVVDKVLAGITWSGRACAHRG